MHAAAIRSRATADDRLSSGKAPSHHAPDDCNTPTCVHHQLLLLLLLCAEAWGPASEPTAASAPQASIHLLSAAGDPGESAAAFHRAADLYIGGLWEKLNAGLLRQSGGGGEV